MKSAAQKHSGFTPMLKNVFRRNILSLILAPLVTLFVTSIIITSNLNMKPSEVEDITVNFSLLLSSVLAVFAFIISLIVAYTLYRELFSRRASDFLLAMPVKREAYYNANFLFGVINIALSYIITFAVSVFLIKSDLVYPTKFYIFDVAFFSKLLLMSFFAVVAVFALFIVSAVISGRKWHYFVISYFVVSGGFKVATGLSDYVNTIWGFALERDYSFIVSPLISLVSSVNDRIKDMIPILIALVVQIVVVYTAGLIAFKHRKAEVAETTVFGKILPIIIITVFLLSNVFSFFSFSANIFISIIAAFISIIISVLIITALFYRKPFNKLTLTSLALSVGITAMIICCVEFIPKATGYIDYVPEISEVESVTVDASDDAWDMPRSLGLLTDTLIFYYDDGLGEYEKTRYTFNLSTDEAKAAVSALHKKMASEEAKNKYYDVDTYEYDATNGIKLEYKLKNGKTVVRHYMVNASVASDEFAAVLKTDECLNQIAPANMGNDILFVEVSPYYPPDSTYDYWEDTYTIDEDENEDVETNYLKLDDYSAFLECIKKDLKKTDYNYTLLYENGFDSEYYKQWDENSMYYGERKDAVCTLTFYTLKANAPEEEKAKMLKMSPEEMQAYDNKRVEESGFELDFLLESCAYHFAKSDNNTMKFIESKGYKF